jgi:hypothetical protein
MVLSNGWVIDKSYTAHALNGYATGFDGGTNILTLAFDTGQPQLVLPAA